jgi:hypothetical protein
LPIEQAFDHLDPEFIVGLRIIHHRPFCTPDTIGSIEFDQPQGLGLQILGQPIGAPQEGYRWLLLASVIHFQGDLIGAL